MGKPAELIRGRVLAALALALITAMATGPGAAQQPPTPVTPTVERRGCGDDASTFGTECSLKELEDAVDINGNKIGAIIIRNVPVDPPVTLVFEAFNTNNLIANGTNATNTDEISVEPTLMATNAPGLAFRANPNSNWSVVGGVFNFAPQLKRETIEFTVRAIDPQTGQTTARIKDASLIQIPKFVGSVDSSEEARVEITEEVTSVGGNAGDLAMLKTFESHSGPDPVANDPPDGIRESQPDDNAEFTPQSEVEVKKQINLLPGRSGGNLVTLDTVGQLFSLTTDDEVGFLDEFLERQDGSAQQVGVGRLRPGQSLALSSFLLAQSAGITRFITTGQNGEHPFILHRSIGVVAASTALYLSALFNPLDPLGNLVFLGDFDDGSLLLSKLTFGPNPGDLLSDVEVFFIDTDTGDVAPIVRLGDPVTVGGVDYTIDGLFGGQVTASGRAYLNVDLIPVGGAPFPKTGAVLVFDTSQLFSGGGAPLIDSWFPGDTVQTASGPVQLGGLVEVLDADDLTDNLVIRSVQFSLGSPNTIYAAKGGSKTDVRRVAGTGDPVPGSTDQVFLFQSAKVNQFGDVGLGIFTGPAGGFSVSGSAALLSRETAATQFLLKKGDPLPDGSGFTVEGVTQVMVGEGRKAAVMTNFLNAQNQGAFTLIPYDYDDTGSAAAGAPLITTGDILRDAGGLGNQVTALQVEPRGLGDSLAAVFALLFDGTRAVLRIPLNAQAVAVPDVVGLLQAAAEADIVAAGLIVGTVTTQASNTVLAGDVISQNPAAGTQVAPNSAVDLVVSSGPAQIAVPDVVSLPQAAAEADIVAFGLVVGTVSTANSNTVPAGDVISQSPAAGSQVAQGSAVDLVVSSGPALLSVPDVVGLSQASAEAAIVAAGLTVGAVSTANSNVVPAGDVISQSPGAGGQMAPGAAVDLLVSSGPAPVLGDLDGDGDVDRDDLNIILAARNMPASGPGDPRDLDGDGLITVLDARKLTQLCTRPRCATQ